MNEMFDYDKAYQTKMESALFKSILETSLSDDKKFAMMRSPEICQAGINIIAFVIHSSNHVSSPTKLGKVCNDFSKQLRRRIVAFQESAARGDLDFFSTIHEGEIQ